jgi:acetyl-CoA carboxylase biotin carboxyl carrier protein
MQSSEFERIKRVVDAFERSDWSEIDVRTGDIRIHLAVGAPDAPAPTDRSPTDGPTAVAGADVGRPAARRPAAADVQPATDRSQTSDHPRQSDVFIDDGHVVTAPTPGIFWRAPEPGAPPFADVGDTVEASDTVCIVEVMKLMNSIEAGVRGTVRQIAVENAAAVEAGEVLLAIEPLS